MFKNDDEHREHIVDEIGEYINEKYLKGQKAHGGHLWRKNLTHHAIEEAADLCVYLFTKREQESLIVGHLVMALGNIHAGDDDVAYDHIQNAINILTIGNPEGIEEEEREK